MIEILILLLLVIPVMAKHGSRRRYRRYIRGKVELVTNMTTLGADTAIRAAMAETVNERAFVTSAVLRWTISDATVAADVGPFQFGLAHSSYTITEIDEFLTNSGSWNEGDLPQQEIAKRKIKIVGTLSAKGDGLSDILNDGKAVKTKLNMMLNQGDTVAVWVKNLGSAAVSTTVPQMFCEGHVNIWPN